MLEINLIHLLDDAKCYETVRKMRWLSAICCPKCNSLSIIKRGKDETQVERQRYQYKGCGVNFDDLPIQFLLDTINRCECGYCGGYCVCI
jgi:hypothetical protein